MAFVFGRGGGESGQRLADASALTILDEAAQIGKAVALFICGGSLVPDTVQNRSAIQGIGRDGRKGFFIGLKAQAI